MVTIKRRKWGSHYRIIIYGDDGKMITSMKWSPKQGITVKRLKSMREEELLAFLPKKGRTKMARELARKRKKELEREMLKYKSAYVDYVFRDWFETKDKTKKTRVTYEVHFTTVEKQPFHDQNEFTITDIFTSHLQKGTYNFMRDVLGTTTKRGRKKPLPFAYKALGGVHGTCNVEDIDYRRRAVPSKIELDEVTHAEFRIMKNGRIYEYDIDYKFYIEDYVEDAVSDIKMLR